MNTKMSRHDIGVAKMNELFGPGAESAVKALSDTNPALAQYLVEFPFGDVYSRPALDSKTREMLTVAALIVLGYASAVKWYTLAAEQGNANAQNNMGLRYANGRGVPQDYVFAHMWMNIAASKGNKKTQEHLGTLAKLMSPAQIAEAQRVAREWLALHQK